MRNKIFYVLCLVVFFSSCRKDDFLESDFVEKPIVQNPFVDTEYINSVFVENYSDLYLYQELKMKLDCNNYDILENKNDTLTLCVPIKVNYIASQKYYLLLKSFGGGVRSTIIGVNEDVELRSEPDPIDLPDVIVTDLCSRMSHICSDPFDPEFLSFVNRKYRRHQWDPLIEEMRENRDNDYPWDKLNEDEKDFVRKHPIAAKRFFENSKKAFKFVQNEDGAHNGLGDAKRHAYWSALNAKSEGEDLAREFGNAHENNPGQPISEREMDLFNNEVGYNIGVDALKNGWSDSRIQEEVNKAAADGRLKTSI